MLSSTSLVSCASTATATMGDDDGGEEVRRCVVVTEEVRRCVVVTVTHFGVDRFPFFNSRCYVKKHYTSRP
jgi:hypothetical protein